MMKWKPIINEYDELLAAYFDRDRLLRELHEFYKFTSFRRSLDLHVNPMHTFEYDIVDKDNEDDTIDFHDHDWDTNVDYSATPPRSRRPRDVKIQEKNVSFETSTTLNTTMGTAEDSVLLEEGLSRTSPNTHLSGVSFSSGNSSISDLKIKKRQIERAYERRFPRYPLVVSLASSHSWRSLDQGSFKGKR
jgi:hypothetical protein